MSDRKEEEKEMVDKKTEPGQKQDSVSSGQESSDAKTNAAASDSLSVSSGNRQDKEKDNDHQQSEKQREKKSSAIKGKSLGGAGAVAHSEAVIGVVPENEDSVEDISPEDLLADSEVAARDQQDTEQTTESVGQDQIPAESDDSVPLSDVELDKAEDTDQSESGMRSHVSNHVSKPEADPWFKTDGAHAANSGIDSIVTPDTIPTPETSQHPAQEHATDQIVGGAGQGTNAQAVASSQAFNAYVGGQSGLVVEDQIGFDRDSGSFSKYGGLNLFDAQQVAGQFGTLILQPDGTWSYQLDNQRAEVQELGATQRVEDVITVVAKDNSTHQVHIFVQGTNDVPVITSIATHSAQEGDSILSGRVGATDVDTGDQLVFSTTTQVDGFQLNPDGSYVFDPGAGAYDQLAAGQQLSLDIPVTVTDSAGGSATQILHIGLTGTNDAPEVSNIIPPQNTSQGAAFAFPLPANTFSDIDTGDGLVFSTGTLPGWLSFDPATGEFSGTPTNADVGTTQVTVTATDSQGATVSTTFDLNVANTNDVPTLDAISTVSVTEDGALATGQITSTDPDVGDTATYSIAAPVDGLTFNSDGSWSFDPSDGAYQSLPDGQVQTLSIPVTVTDASGATDTQNLVINITGTNDAAQVGGLSTGFLKEDVAVSAGELTAKGRLGILDVDTGEAHFVPQTGVVGSYGTFNIDAQGHWTYVADNSNTDIQELGAKDSVEERFTITSVDGTASRDVVVHIQGTNDTPVIAQVMTTQSATEDAAFTFTVPAGTFDDIDTGDTLTLSASNLPSWLHFDPATGEFSGTPTNGDVGTTQVTVTATDSQGATVSTTFDLNVTNTNDVPTLDPISTFSVTEDGALATGQVTSTDPDVGDTATYSIAAPVDGLTFNSDGTWSFDPSDAAYQSLPDGQVQTLTIPVTVTDASGATDTQNLLINITGTGDRAVITGTDTGDVTEDLHVHAPVQGNYAYKLEAQGTLTAVDPDTGESGFDFKTLITAAMHPEWAPYQSALGGELSINPKGEWNYYIDNRKPEIQELGLGESLTDTVQIVSKDGTTHTITITIHGTNDAPQVGSAIVLSQGTEDTAYTIHAADLLAGTSDIDQNDAGQLHVSGLTSDHGTITDNNDGTYTFTPDADYNGPVAFAYQVQDAHGGSTPATASMDLAAVADAAVITGTGSTLKEDINLGAGSGTQGMLSAYGKLTVVDPDGPAESRFENPLTAGSYKGSLGGSLQVNPDGQYIYHLDNWRVDSLKEGEVAHDRFTVHSVDGTTHTLEFTVQGTNDAPYIQSKLHNACFEDDAVLHGRLGGADVDHGDQQHLTYSSTAQVPGFHLKADGSYTFDPSDAAYQHLTAQDLWGNKVTIPVTVTDQDGLSTTQNLTISIMGRNDAPVVSSDVSLSDGQEDTAVTLRSADLLSHATDADDYETSRLHVSGLAADHGTVTDNHDGTYTFTPDADYNGPVRFSYSVVDPNGASTPASASMNLAAVADAAVISGTDTGSMTEDRFDSTQTANLRAWGKLEVLDPDAGESGFVEHITPLTRFAKDASIHGQYGRLEISEDGHWTYDVPNDHPEVQKLGAGQTLTDTITVASKDGTTHTITVTIHGTNDAPAVSSSVQLAAGTEDTAVTLHAQELLAHATDIDSNDAGQLSIANLVADHGTITDHHDGTYTFNPDPDYNGPVTFTYDVQDSHGGSTPTSASMNLAAVNDAATLAQPAGVAVTEDQSSSTLDSGWQNLDIVDADGTAEARVVKVEVNGVEHAMPANFATSIQGTYGTFRFTHGTDGHDKWSYLVDNTDSRIQGLDATQHLTDTMTLITPDGTRIDVAATIRGTDDGVVIDTPDALTAPLGTVTEDTQPTVSGTLLAHDSDTSDSVSFTPQTVTDAHGTFTVDAQGHWSYTLDPSSSQQLGANDRFAVPFDITATSSDGSTATKHIEVIVEGTNDAPVLSAHTHGVLEDGAILTGQMVATDTDKGDALTYSVAVPVAGFNLNADGSYVFNPSDGAYQSLPDGQVQTLTIPVTVTDASGATDTQNLSIIITGTNDAAIIGGTDFGSIKEDLLAGRSKTLYAGGKLSVADIDSGESQFAPQTAHGDHNLGTFSIRADGSWSYLADNTNPAIQALGENQSISETLTVQSADGTTHMLTVTIEGTNDTPVIAQAISTQSAAEDAAFTFTVPSGTFDDIDTGDTLTLSASNLPSWLHFDPATGEFSGTPTNADVGTTQVSVTATDSQGATVSTTFDLNVANTNDAPSLSPISTVAVDEDGALATGQLSATDPDTGDTLTYSIATPVDGLTVNADGSWQFDPSNSSYQSLLEGQSKTLTIPVTVTDSAGATDTQNLEIVITGSNDAPVVVQAVSGQTASEDHAFSFTVPAGAFGDIDASDTLTLSTGALPAWLSFDPATGEFSGTPANADVGTTQVTVMATDSQGATISTTFDLNVANTNDAPTLNPVGSLKVTEDGAVANGQLTAVDPDAGDTLTYSTAMTFPGFSLNPDGSYTFDPSDPIYQSLADGQVHTVNIPVTVTDAAGAKDTQRLSITITGTNDAPVITGQSTGTVREDLIGTATGKLQAVDADQGESGFQAQTIHGTYGDFSIDAQGNWTFTAHDISSSALQGMSATDWLEEPITVTSIDGTTHNLTMYVVGSNDMPVVSHRITTQTASEDGAFSFLVPANTFTDLDTKDASLNLSASGLPAWLHFDPATGEFSGTPTNSDVGTMQITVTATDSAGYKVSTTFDLTVANTNDAPTLNPISRVSVHEDGAVASGQLVATDPDSGDVLTFSTSASVAGLTLNADGSWEFDPSNAAYQSLADGQTQSLTIPVTVTDSAGASDIKALSITITGTNDAPIIKGTSVGTVQEDGVLSVNDKLEAQDPDAGESAFTPETLQGNYGTLTIDADGNWEFDLDNSAAAVQALNSGDTQQDSFDVHTVDGSVQRIVVSVQGTDEAPVVQTVVDHSPVIDQTNMVVHQTGTSLGGTLTAKDPDVGESHTWSVSTTKTGSGSGSSIHGHYGTLNIDPNTGTWEFHPDGGGAGVQKTGTMPSGSGHEFDTFYVTNTDAAGHTHTLKMEIELQVDAQHVHGHSGHWIARIEPLDAQLSAADEQSSSYSGEDLTFDVALVADDPQSAPVDDYLQVFADAGAVDASASDAPEDSGQESMAGALAEQGAVFTEGASPDQNLDPAALADFLNEQDKAIHPDDSSAVPQPDDTFDPAGGVGIDVDDPTLWQRDDHTQ